MLLIYCEQVSPREVEKGNKSISFELNYKDIFSIQRDKEPTGLLYLMHAIRMFFSDDNLEDNMSRRVFERNYTIRNSGRKEMTVKGMSIGHSGCSGHGFRIVNCEEFHLQPNQNHTLQIRYENMYTTSYYKTSLRFYTEFNLQSFDLLSIIPYNLLQPATQNLEPDK
jgi:hypothetical protein